MMKQHTNTSEIFICLRQIHNHHTDLNTLKEETIKKYAAQKTKGRLNRFLSVVKDARDRGPMRAQTSLLQGPEMVSSHFVHTCQGPDDGEAETDDTPIVMFDRVLHGVKHLTRAREGRVQSLVVYRLCVCGVCVTEDDLKHHYSLLLLAAQMALSERVPKAFFDYVKDREKEVFRKMQNAEMAANGERSKSRRLSR